jgi:hypothetical protein
MAGAPSPNYNSFPLIDYLVEHRGEVFAEARAGLAAGDMPASGNQYTIGSNRDTLSVAVLQATGG